MEPRATGRANSYKELGMGNICQDGWLWTSDGHVCPGSPAPFLNRNILSSYPVSIPPLFMRVCCGGRWADNFSFWFTGLQKENILKKLHIRGPHLHLNLIWMTSS